MCTTVTVLSVHLQESAVLADNHDMDIQPKPPKNIGVNGVCVCTGH